MGSIAITEEKSATKVTGKAIKDAASEYSSTSMVINMRELGSKTKSTGQALSLRKMGQSTKVSGLKISLMGRVCLQKLMVPSLKVGMKMG